MSSAVADSVGMVSPRRGVLLHAIGRIYPVLLILLAWELIAASGWVSKLLWPSLESVAYELWRMTVNGDIAFHGVLTIERAVEGFILALIVGIPLGALLARSRFFNKLFEPLFVFTYPVPKISLYPVFVFIFGYGDLSKVVLIFLECLYPIALQTAAGMRNTERVLVWAAENCGASAPQLFWRVLVPSAAPSIFAGIRIALPISLIVTIITELIGESRGLGYLVAFASASYEPARAMAAFVVIACIGFVFDRAFIALRRRVVFWLPESSRLRA